MMFNPDTFATSRADYIGGHPKRRTGGLSATIVKSLVVALSGC
jgi:hypothetical protein